MGDKATVTSIAQGDEDPHFVQPKPSFVAVLRDADMFVTTGIDLELWVPRCSTGPETGRCPRAAPAT